MKNYESMTVAELRDFCRKNKNMHNLSGVEIISKQKHELIDALNGQTTQNNDGGDLFNREPKNNGGNNNGGDLAQAIAAAVQNHIKPALDGDAVNALIDARFSDIDSMISQQLQALKPRKATIEIKNIETGTTKDVGLQHAQFETILKLASARLNVYMVGAAGSGKTYLAEQVAQALDLPFYAISVGLQTSKSDLIGYMNATGDYVKTMLREAFEHGGIFLIDEIDAGNPNVLTVINALTSNSVAAFPDGMVKKHADFIVLAAANTYGRGADRQYVGRNPLDGATLDRFGFVAMDIDEALELELAPNAAWCERVQNIRKAIFELKEKVICSPRATINGGKAIAAGMSTKDAEDMFIFRGINSDIKERVLSRIGS